MVGRQPGPVARALDTHDGLQPLHEVLEGTTSHVARHARQLEHLLELRGIVPNPRLAPALLTGLRLREEVWTRAGATLVMARKPLLMLLATLAALPAPAETLLVVRKTDDAMDFIDPGSGLRLATVALGHAPHEVSVSPDGQRAVVSNYGTREQPGSTLSLVDLEQPREIRRIDLTPHTRPHGVAWFANDRIAVTTEGSKHLLVVEPDSGRIVTRDRDGSGRFAHGRDERRWQPRLRHQHRLRHDHGARPRRGPQARRPRHGRGVGGAGGDPGRS